MTDDNDAQQATTRRAGSDDDTLEALASLPEFYHPTVSPDGDRIAFYHDETGRNELYVLDVESGERTQVSDGNVPENAMYPIAWDADGDRVFFHRDQDDGDEQNDIYAITLDGDVDLVVETDGQTNLQDVSPDGSRLLYSTTATGQMNLHVHDVATGESTQLTAYDRPASFGQFSPDGDRVAYRTNERDDLDNEDPYVASLAALDADRDEGVAPAGGEDAGASGDGDAAVDAHRLDVGDVGAETTIADWFPSGDAVLLSDDSEDTTRPGVYDLESGSVTWYGSPDREEVPAFVLPDGDGFLARRARDCAEVAVHYERDDTDAATELDLLEGVARFPGSSADDGVLADGRVLVTHETPTTRQRLLAHDLDADASDSLVDAEYGRFDPDDFAPCDVVTYESTDGLDIEALVYDSGERPSPAIVMVHGGPSAAESRRFNARVQFLVDEGYTVMLPNYRGSTGRGREFKHRINGDWGGMEQVDVAEAGRWLKRRDWVDAERVAVYGGSYGGYSTYMQLVQRPGFWSAGAAFVGMTDLELLYEKSMPHFQSYLEQLVGDPDEDADLYRDRSAITHVDDMEDPLLMVHGVNDPRCPISQARTFRDALLERGWEEGEEFEYVELGEEGHTSTDADHKIRTFRLTADFFDRRL
ncbi:S9 family peptidase [Halorubellus litoreus]|uniref:S9 family peptidase n=1 Tax=Halorubellus litoreus TaxID=755308 RepID=A0ABD5VM60_9EURY